ncbi:hypothetical protein EV379_3286 [Microterricola gilva]|uniref:FAR-17a/AIG1-like protein n=1 Tax=Microterricola gilva TaxID=393267 RepID=A0A4V2GB65_9MICO|nr:Pr6Pr family membrane protein [Microterricola gilva]RZU66916.1 hypothetical protein EV379_3286 [Microterricola gilva]
MTDSDDYAPTGRTTSVDEAGRAAVAGAPARHWASALTGTTAARVWHGVVAAMTLTGVSMEIYTILVDTIPDVGQTVVLLGLLFSYFTILSNVLVGVTCLMLVIDPHRDGPIFRIARLDAVLCMAITGIVYNTVLAGLQELSKAGEVSNFFMHQAGPLLAVLGWFVVGPRPRVDRSTIWWSMAAPLAWIAYTFVAGAVSGHYPYPFMRATEIGYPAALLNTGVVVVIFLVGAALLGWIDRKLPAAPTG